MVVRFSQKSDTGSNKPEKYSVQLTASAYRYKRPVGYRVTVLKPKVDCLSFTFPVESVTDKYAIRENLMALAGDTGTPEITNWQKIKNWGAAKYAMSFGLDVSKDQRILIQCTAGQTNTPFLRIQFNPNIIGPKGVAKFREAVPKITKGKFDYNDFLKGSRVTRIDIAVDLINVDVEDLLISTNTSGKKMSYFGVGGKLETAYQNTSNTTYVYDKRQKQTDDGIEPEYGNAPHRRHLNRIIHPWGEP